MTDTSKPLERSGRVGAPPAATAPTTTPRLDIEALSSHIRPTGWCVSPTSRSPTDRIQGTRPAKPRVRTTLAGNTLPLRVRSLNGLPESHWV